MCSVVNYLAKFGKKKKKNKFKNKKYLIKKKNKMIKK